MVQVAPRPPLPLAFRATCQCGKVHAYVQALEKYPPLRLVCYCRDCRGYCETLNRLAATTNANAQPPAKLDAWGGMDWTALYPRDITIEQGHEYLATAKIREKSSIRQVYTTCCHTPMFRFGSMSALVNSHILVANDEQHHGIINEEDKNGLPIEFRVIGRQAWKMTGDDNTKPRMSSSVPLRWFWTMPFRIHKNLMEPMPMELPKVEDCKILADFSEGSTTPPPLHRHSSDGIGW